MLVYCCVNVLLSWCIVVLVYFIQGTVMRPGGVMPDYIKFNAFELCSKPLGQPQVDK
jgi:hypothetical protein